MKFKGYEYPKGEKHTAESIYNEWNNKGAQVLDLLERIYAPETGSVIQAGANCGYFAVQLAKAFDHVVTFEPIPELWNLAKKNIRKHGGDNISLFNMGLGREADSASITFTEDGNCGATGLSADEDGELELMSIDNLYLSDCQLIWLDIEGMEAEALRGAENTINRCRPLIVVENKGLIHGFDSEGEGQELRQGNSQFRRWFEKEYGYKRVTRLMRDDVFIPVEYL